MAQLVLVVLRGPHDGYRERVLMLSARDVVPLHAGERICLGTRFDEGAASTGILIAVPLGSERRQTADA